MRMRIAWFSFALVVLASTAHAETLRCKSSLISPGASQDYVLQKCGPPASKMEVNEPVMARRPNGTTYQVGTTTREIWRYDRSPGKFPAVMTFEEGVLKKLEFEK